MKKQNSQDYIKKDFKKVATRNSELLEEFTQYCEKYPEQRFWQALRNWSESSYIILARFRDEKSGCWAGDDTFYFENKNES